MDHEFSKIVLTSAKYFLWGLTGCMALMVIIIWISSVIRWVQTKRRGDKADEKEQE
jgi:hypothetical protein